MLSAGMLAITWKTKTLLAGEELSSVSMGRTCLVLDGEFKSDNNFYYLVLVDGRTGWLRATDVEPAK